MDIVADSAARHAAKRVVGVKLLVGRMTGVEPEALRFCFASLAAGTVAAEAELEIELAPLCACCRDCGEEFGVENYRFLCPQCGSAAVEVISGRELRVEHLEVE